MSFRTWWQKKSGRAKAITIVATLLILQIGLCFGTPVGVSWSDTWFHTRLGNDSLGGLGYMVFEAVCAIVTFLVLIGVVIFYPGAARNSNLSISSRGDDKQD